MPAGVGLSGLRPPLPLPLLPPLPPPPSCGAGLARISPPAAGPWPPVNRSGWQYTGTYILHARLKKVERSLVFQQLRPHKIGKGEQRTPTSANRARTFRKTKMNLQTLADPIWSMLRPQIAHKSSRRARISSCKRMSSLVERRWSRRDFSRMGSTQQGGVHTEQPPSSLMTCCK